MQPHDAIAGARLSQVVESVGIYAWLMDFTLLLAFGEYATRI